MRFDLETYKAHADRVRWDDLDLATAFADRPLTEPDLRCLRYMHDVEQHTVCYLRDLLATRAHDDARITTFLSFWVHEELWHGEALAAVLTAHGEPAGEARIVATRRRLGWRTKLGPTVWNLASLALRDLPAVHMAWGAVNEWTTQAGYARLAARADHPTLTALLRRIMKQEGRHIDFYASEAQARLAVSATARRLTRAALRRAWAPVGSGVMPDGEVAFLTGYLFGDEDGAAVAARIDRRIDRLPGLAGLGLLARARRALAPEDGILPAAA